jgi:PAS domain-containing protein
MIHKKQIDPPKLEQYIDNSKVLIEALESVQESVYMFDASTNKALYANRSILHILGYSSEQID